MPGVIRVFEESGEVSGVLRFPVGGQYFPSGPPGSLAPDGQRNTTLGTNMSVPIFVISVCLSEDYFDESVVRVCGRERERDNGLLCLLQYCIVDK